MNFIEACREIQHGQHMQSKGMADDHCIGKNGGWEHLTLFQHTGHGILKETSPFHPMLADIFDDWYLVTWDEYGNKKVWKS